MIIHDIKNTPAVTDLKGTKDTIKRVLIAGQDGAQRFYMRHFTIKGQGFTPRHAHPWEHEIYIISGDGRVFIKDKDAPVSSGMAIFIPAMDEHQIKAGDNGMEFLCMIPANTGG
ncbi:MAG: cupin domain-containing protein [Thermodesulfobacteriota bacterium]|nr:cupin domain-containing protein [Thermodesulfobacteriota bacterium]